jgi:hypothetical protein
MNIQKNNKNNKNNTVSPPEVALLPAIYPPEVSYTPTEEDLAKEKRAEEEPSRYVSSSVVLERALELVRLLQYQEKKNKGKECPHEQERVPYTCDCCWTVSPNDGCCNILCDEYDDQIVFSECKICSLYYRSHMGDFKE